MNYNINKIQQEIQQVTSNSFNKSSTKDTPELFLPYSPITFDPIPYQKKIKGCRRGCR